MKRLTYLGVTPPAEAWLTVLRALKDSDFCVRAAAKRLRVSHEHLYKWMREHPSIKEKFLRARVKFLKEQVERT